jgi:hypothetical protein
MYFIDRNPKYFDRILDYLRTGKLQINGLNAYGRDKIKQDLDYFQIPPPVNFLLQWDKTFCSAKLRLSDDGLTVTSTGAGAVLGNLPKDHFAVTILKKKSDDLLVGFAPTLTFPLVGNYEHCGWFLSIGSGCVCHLGRDIAYIGSPVAEGSVVEAIYNRERKEISFVVNGHDYGVAFSNIKERKLYPAVDMWVANLSVSLK